jgi:putative hydrolase of the HAD superfamily
MTTPSRQHLIFDADDTLWENNIVFEGVIADFIAGLDHPGMSAAEVREVMDGIEREHAAEYGYGILRVTSVRALLKYF